ncbi:MAG: hypothetical protein KME42_14720 [Tildeniella nuda ZEHNDER 1965/U140]|jgi:hypothetical protein|nr:hypothetical protein [Tildeniella nuda ZEHNDER 1965/U140]
MIDQKTFLQAGCLLQSCSPVAKILTVTLRRLLTIAVFTPATIVLFTAHPLSAQAQSCATSYEPGALSQRTKSGLLDSRIGPIKVINNTETATVISLYHPDAPKRIFKYWYAEPGKSYLLGADNYTSDWGIQVDEGPICVVGRVASWDGRVFTTFPSRLFIADAPTAAELSVSRSQTLVSTPPLPQPPETYEAIASRQIIQGDARNGLISLLRAADLYRASGRGKEEQRVRDRIQEIGNTGKASVSKP